jgi:hypothetical protein
VAPAGEVPAGQFALHALASVVVGQMFARIASQLATADLMPRWPDEGEGES